MDFLKQMYGLAQKRAACMDCGAGRQVLPVRSFKSVLKGMAVIAEVKYATPADGPFGITETPSVLAAGFEALGASAISCLTEPEFFQGSMSFLPQIRNACSLPVLMKDFIVDERQIVAGRSFGADAFLLITEMLSDDELARLYSLGRSLGMDCLVEVHGPEGLEKALRIGAEIIGVNVRNLETLKVVPGRHEETIRLLPEGVVKVAESGISSAARLRALKNLGYDAALIGRALAKPDVRRELLQCG